MTVWSICQEKLAINCGWVVGRLAWKCWVEGGGLDGSGGAGGAATKVATSPAWDFRNRGHLLNMLSSPNSKHLAEVGADKVTDPCVLSMWSVHSSVWFWCNVDSFNAKLISRFSNSCNSTLITAYAETSPQLRPRAAGNSTAGGGTNMRRLGHAALFSGGKQDSVVLERQARDAGQLGGSREFAIHRTSRARSRGWESKMSEHHCDGWIPFLTCSVTSSLAVVTLLDAKPDK